MSKPILLEEKTCAVKEYLEGITNRGEQAKRLAICFGVQEYFVNSDVVVG